MTELDFWRTNVELIEIQELIKQNDVMKIRLYGIFGKRTLKFQIGFKPVYINLPAQKSVFGDSLKFLFSVNINGV